jgi:hypothetical protein
MTVGELKVKIEERIGITAASQKLYTSSKMLRDELSLRDYKIQKDSLLIVMRAR